MVPVKIKVVAIINILLSMFFLVVFGLILIGSMITMLTDPLYIIMAIISLISMMGWIFLIIGSILLLFGKKAGFYLLLISWVFSLPNMTSLPGIALFLWMTLSLDMIRNNDESRQFLKLSDSALFEKSWKKKKDEEKLNPVQSTIQSTPESASESKDALQTYIQDAKSKGYSDAQIKAVLTNSGYTDLQLKDYFK